MTNLMVALFILSALVLTSKMLTLTFDIDSTLAFDLSDHSFELVMPMLFFFLVMPMLMVRTLIPTDVFPLP